ncbi:MAG: Magnesium transporter MgtE [Stenotrophomonas maltophilia]|nr:MAG: Magnesium transporter MgtE [Stenotrophomonas maltophilia]
MNSSLPHWLRRLAPCAGPASLREGLRAIFGCALALALALLGGALLFGAEVVARIAPPIAASSLLAVAVASSPLAQPWSVAAGNTVAALCGLLVGHWLGHDWQTATLAMGVAVTAMLALRCLHPPSTAMAVSLCLGGPLVEQYGLSLAWPVLVTSTLLCLLALLYNNLTRTAYPRPLSSPAAQPHHTADPLPSQRLAVRSEDLRHALQDFDSFVDVTTDDLERLLHAAEFNASQRLLGGISARQIMSTDIRSIGPAARVEEAWRLLDAHHLKALPVLQDGRLVGILTLTDLFRGMHRRGLQRLRSAFGQTVGNLMTHRVRTISEDTPLAELVAPLSDHGLHCLPVVNAQGQLVGMLSQSDLIAAVEHLWAGRETPVLPVAV